MSTYHLCACKWTPLCACKWTPLCACKWTPSASLRLTSYRLFFYFCETKTCFSENVLGSHCKEDSHCVPYAICANCKCSKYTRTWRRSYDTLGSVRSWHSILFTRICYKFHSQCRWETGFVILDNVSLDKHIPNVCLSTYMEIRQSLCPRILACRRDPNSRLRAHFTS